MQVTFPLNSKSVPLNSSPSLPTVSREPVATPPVSVAFTSALCVKLAGETSSSVAEPLSVTLGGEASAEAPPAEHADCGEKSDAPDPFHVATPV